MKLYAYRPLLCAVVAAALAGCASAPGPSVRRDDFEAACSAVCERRLVPCTVEMLEALADRHVGRERQLARLESAVNEDFGNFNAADDPRFMWAREVDCYARMLIFPEFSRPGGPEEMMEQQARRMLRFGQAMWWARFAACRDLRLNDREREACVLALELTTGWPESRIAEFDFATLPDPGRTPSERAVASDSEAGRRLVTAAAELLTLAHGASEPTIEAVRAKRAELNRERVALARKYLTDARARWKKSRDQRSLAAWRIARARYELEKSLSDL